MRDKLIGMARGLHKRVFSPLGQGTRQLFARRGTLLTVVLAAASAWVLIVHPPVQSVEPGSMAVRTNRLTGDSDAFRDGSVWVLPGLHSLRAFELRDQIYRPVQGRKADGEAPFQSVEGLSLGVDLTVRFAFDPAQVSRMARALPTDIGAEVVEPAVQGVIYRTFTRYTVREIFSVKRAEIQKTIESELRARLAGDGIVLRSVQVGKVDLPADYRRGMDRLLAEELETREDALHARAEGKAGPPDRARSRSRQGPARDGGQGRRARTGHRGQGPGGGDAPCAALQAKADRTTQVRGPGRDRAARAACRSARPRRAASRRRAKPTRASSWPTPRPTGSTGSARSRPNRWHAKGSLLTRHPLLIQKTVADKLSDKVQVIIAPPGAGGQFIGSGLIGALPAAQKAAASEEGS